MTSKEMWQAYKKINPEIGDEIDAWAFGTLADQLADLVIRGEKTATASAYELYKLENEPLPQVGSFDVILDKSVSLKSPKSLCCLLMRFQPNTLLRKGKEINPWPTGNKSMRHFSQSVWQKLVWNFPKKRVSS